MKRITGLAIAAALLGGACAGHGAVSLGPAPSPHDQASPSPRPTGTRQPSASNSPSASAPASPSSPAPIASPTGLVTVQAWFTRGGSLFETKRTEPATTAVARLALTELLQGPSYAEQAVSVGTAIPAGTSLRGVTISNGTATVDLSGSFEANASSSTMALRLAQVVYTATQFSTVQGVTFMIDGVGKTVVGGVPVQQPQTRAMWAAKLPPILVETPTTGATVSSPVLVSGTADVFEATVTIRVLNADGQEIARTFTTATCGTGCRGAFSARVTYHVSTRQAGRIEVLDYSAKDGSPQDVQDIPVTLAA